MFGPTSHKFGTNPALLYRSSACVALMPDRILASLCRFTGADYLERLLSHRRKTYYSKRQNPGSMAKRDQLTGKGPVAGNHVSHAHNKAKRRFEPNIQKKRFYIPEEDRWVTLRVSAKTIKTINKNGIAAVLKKARANGIHV